RTGRRIERFAGHVPLERVADTVLLEDAFDDGLESVDGLHRRVAQVESSLELARYYIGRASSRIEVGDLEAGGLEVLIALVPGARGELGQGRRESVHRILGELRIRNVPLHAMHREPAGERAATSDLDGVAELLLARRLADDAPVDLLTALAQRLDHLL